MAKLNAKALGVAMGVIWAVGMVLLQLLVGLFHLGTKAFVTMSRFYPGGYRGTPLSGLMLVIWSFVYGLAYGAVLAWLYNKLSKENK